MQADLIVKLIQSMSQADQNAFHKVANELIANEKKSGHRILAERMERALRPTNGASRGNLNLYANSQKPNGELIYEITPERRLDGLLLPPTVERQVRGLVVEQHRADLLHSRGLRARHRLLFVGPPGNGKTTLAEALAYELMYPLIVIRYEAVIGSYLGETSARIKNILEYAKTQRCVLFFDEFETLGKERGDARETGEIKRIVSSLLLQTDSLPDYVVLVAASNHPELLDRAVWRRFQVQVELPLPTVKQREQLIKNIAKRCGVEYGCAVSGIAKGLEGANYAEIEQFCLDIVRRLVLSHGEGDAKKITEDKKQEWREMKRLNKGRRYARK